MLCPNCFREHNNDLPCSHCGYQEKGRNLLALPVNTLINGQYIIGRVLGQGGFGITYLAWDPGLETKVAIKEYMPRDLVGRTSDGRKVSVYSEKEEDLFRFGRERFIQEARTLAKFDHPNVVRVRSVFEEHGTACLVMDYYEGLALSEYLERLKSQGEQLPLRTATDIMLRVMDGLKEVHNKSFLHRDIKPQNIYITRDGRPILLDFGAARAAVGERSLSLSVIYTPGFAPYEQYQRKGEQGPWTDVYACAATLYYLVTGVMPPDSIDRAAEDTLIPPKSVVPGLPDSFERVLLQALAVQHRQRYQTMGAFQEELLSSLTLSEGTVQSFSQQTVLQDKHLISQPSPFQAATEVDIKAQESERLRLDQEAAKKVEEEKRPAKAHQKAEVKPLEALQMKTAMGPVPDATAMEPIPNASPVLEPRPKPSQVKQSAPNRKKLFLMLAAVMILVATVLGGYFIRSADTEIAVTNGTYKGPAKDGKPEGKGIISYNDGGKFEGMFQNGKRQGKGKLTAADGKVVYDGEWKDDKRNGKGQSYGRYSDRDDMAFIKYDGLWDNDVKQGQAVAWIYKASGEEMMRYEGNFKKDRMEDTDAKIYFPNGAKYQGSINNDRFNGQGTFTFANGRVQSGWWENDRFVR